MGIMDFVNQMGIDKSNDALERNVEMCLKASLVIAFWDGYSYGTAHTIAQAMMRKIPVIIYHISRVAVM